MEGVCGEHEHTCPSSHTHTHTCNVHRQPSASALATAAALGGEDENEEEEDEGERAAPVEVSKEGRKGLAMSTIPKQTSSLYLLSFILFFPLETLHIRQIIALLSKSTY